MPERQRSSRKPTLVTGVMDVNGNVNVPVFDSHHDRHLDDRDPRELFNEEPGLLMSPLAGVTLSRFSYRQPLGYEEDPPCAAYDSESNCRE